MDVDQREPHCAGMATVPLRVWAALVVAGPVGSWLWSKVVPGAPACGHAWLWLKWVIFAPLIEEFVFRGLLQAALAPYARAWGANLLTSLAFAAFHALDKGVLLALAVFPVSLLLGYLFQLSGSVRACAMLHSFYNLSLLVVLCS